MTFGEKFRRLVRDKGWSLNHVIREIHQHQPTVQRWLKGEGWPNPADLREIGRVLSVDIGWLIDDRLGWEDQPAYSSQTWMLAQVLELVGRIGPEEALARLRSSRAAGADRPAEPAILLTSPRDGEGEARRPRKRTS